MSVRLHVAAARDVTREQFVEAFARKFGDRWGEVQTSSDNGWHWFTASVWGVAGGDLDEALAALPGPALRVTTEDACRWYLILRAPGQEAHVLCHQFSDLPRGDADENADDAPDPLAFLRDPESVNLKPLPEPCDEIRERFRDLGRPLPDDLIESLRGFGYTRIQRALQQHFAQETVDALERCGVPHDRDEVVGCLTGATVDEKEYHDDIGNLPRFLVALGLEGEWRQTLELQLNPPEDEACEPAPPPDPREKIDAIASRAGEMTPVPVRDGPAIVPLDRAIHVADVAWYCGEWVQAAWTLDLPPGGAAGFGLQSAGDTYVVIGGERVEVGEEAVIPCHQHVDRSPLSAALQALPDGTRIDLVTVGQEPMDEKAEAARMRFAGTVECGAWRIEAAWPEAPREAIEAAVDLTVAAEAGGGLTARDEAEAEAIAEAAACHPMLDSRSARREGLCFSSGSWLERYLALVIFRLRYSEIWNTQPYADEDAEMAEDWGEIESPTTAPHAQEVFFQGEAAEYYEANLEELAKLNKKALRKAEAGMQGLGLQPVGDVCCERFDGVIVRGYGAAGSLWWGVHMQAIDGQAYTEFVTRFADGSGLTTTNNRDARSFPDTALYSRVYGKADVARLHAKHLDGIRRVKAHRQTEPLAIQPSHLGLARAIDDYLQRRGNEPGMVSYTIG
jgi:hypothetical protein